MTQHEILVPGINPPLVIAVGQTKSTIEQYYVQIDGNLIPMPNKSFLDAIDTVFKLHFIYNIKFEHNVKSFWLFIQKYIYNINTVVSPIISEVYLKLNRE